MPAPSEDPSWTPVRHALWQRVAAHDFDPPHALSFTRRLARDRGWSLAFARGAIAAYRRFCFLACAAGVPVTPSEEVDEVWHQHLTYSRDYWERWCPDVLGAKLHHEPTQGGPAEDQRFLAQYAGTLAAYERFFGPPPEAYWPATHRRFRARPRFRIHDADAWFALPRPRALLQRLGGRG